MKSKSLKEDFLNILSNYQGIIHKVCLLYFKSDADKKDNFQEIVYQLWKSFPRLENKIKIASWIYSVAINTSISQVRKDSRLVYQELLGGQFDYLDADYQMDRNEEFKLLLEAIQRLNAIDRSVMLLYLEEYSYDEIADITGVSKSNVGVRINRAKKELQKYLKDLDYER